jgi:hypothetical protein
VGVLTVAPLAGRGYLLLLDWAPGRRPGVPETFFGLSGGLVTGAIYTMATAAAGALAPAALGWLPLALFFPVAGIGMARLVPGRTIERLAGALLFMVNPLVLDRAFAGQLAFLLGYALLPWLLVSLLAARDAAGWRRLRPALWLALMTGLSPHFAWLGGVLLLAVLAERRFRLRDMVWGAAILAGAALASSYLVAMLFGGYGRRSGGTADLASFRTAGRSGAVLLNLVGLSGFWRTEPRLLNLRPAGWPAVMAALVVVIGVGVRSWWAAPGQHRALGTTLIAAGFAGFVLALGDRGPTGTLYRWLFLHLPGFSIMREPQKFIALMAVGDAVFFGLGVGALAERLPARWWRIPVAGALIAAPIVATPGLFFGLGGSVHPSHFPTSWYEADAAMGRGPGKVLVLPWHQYQALAFTARRAVASPAGSFFHRQTIVGNNLDLADATSTWASDRSRYLDFVIAHGPETRAFGQLVTPLAIEYVLVSKTEEFPRYGWLREQTDLTPVLESGDLLLLRNAHPVSEGARVARVVQVQDWGELVGLAGTGNLDGVAVRTARQVPGPVRVPPGLGSATGGDAGFPAVRRLSPVVYAVAGAGGGRSENYVVFAEPYDPRWRLAGAHPEELAGGVMGFASGPQPGKLRFGGWWLVRSGWYASAGAVLCMVAAAVLYRRGRRNGRRGPQSSSQVSESRIGCRPCDELD